MKKKYILIISMLLMLFGMSYIAKADEQTTDTLYSYYNATDEYNLTVKYIQDGMYLEAVSVCDAVLSKDISPNDILFFKDLKRAAEERYKAYIDELKNWKYHYVLFPYSRGGGATCFRAKSDLEPYYKDVDDGEIVISEGDPSIQIKIASLSGLPIEAYENRVSYFFSIFIKTLMSEYRDQCDSVELLSDNEIAIGKFDGKQAVVRVKLAEDYVLQKFMMFEHGLKGYIIICTERKYLWSDDFWKQMESVRTTIEVS